MPQESPKWVPPKKPAGEKETLTDQINQIIQSATLTVQATTTKYKGKTDIASIVEELMAWLAAIFYALSRIINACGDKLYSYLKTEITQAFNPETSENSKKSEADQTTAPTLN